MVFSWLVKPKLLISIAMLAVLITAVACSDDEVPTAAPSTPDVVSAAEIQQIVEAAVAAAAPAGATAEEVKQLVEAGVDAVKAEAVSKEEVASLVSQAVADATGSLPKPVSTSEIESIVKSAIATPTPTPLTPKSGGVVPMQGFGDPTGWDPHGGFLVEDAGASSPLYNQLVEQNFLNVGEIVGDLAESFDLSADGLTYTIKIHEGVKFWDGQELTAEDVAFSINRMIESGSSVPVAKTHLDRAEVVDNYTVKVHAAFATELFLKILAVDFMKIVPKHHLDTGVEIRQSENVLGSGPFKLVEYTSGVGYEYEKNPDYFKPGLPYYDGMKVSIIADKGTEIAAFRTGRVLMAITALLHMDMDDLLKLQADQDFSDRFDVFMLDGGAGPHILVNTTKPPFDDKRVRQAFHLALDRHELADGFGLGRWHVGAPMGPNNPYALPQDHLFELPGYRQLLGKKHPDDIARARELMAEAGHPFEEGLTIPLDIPLIEYWPEAALVVKEQFKKALNVDLEIQVQDVGGVVGKLINKDYAMGFLGVATIVNDPDDAFGSLHMDTGRNWTGWTDPEVTRLFNEQQRETDPEKRRELNYEMQRLTLAEGTPYLYYIWKSFPNIVSKRIKTVAGQYVQSTDLFTILKHEREWLEPE